MKLESSSQVLHALALTETYVVKIIDGDAKTYTCSCFKQFLIILTNLFVGYFFVTLKQLKSKSTLVFLFTIDRTTRRIGPRHL